MSTFHQDVTLSSINGTPEEPVSHNPAAKKQVWFSKGDLPPFTQVARVVVPPGEVLPAHAHADMHELFIILAGTARMIVDGETHDLKPGDAIAISPGEVHELSSLAAEYLVFLVSGWICLSEKKVLSLPLLENYKQPQRK